MNHLYVLNNNKYLFSTYARDKSLIFTSYDGKKLSKVQKVINDHHHETKTWIKNIQNIYLFAEDHIQIDMTSTNFCSLDEPVNNVDVTFFDTHNQTDMLFLYQLTELMNTNVYVIKDFEYSKPQSDTDLNDLPLLSLQGFFVEYKPKDIQLEIDPCEYLDAMLQIDPEN